MKRSMIEVGEKEIVYTNTSHYLLLNLFTSASTQCIWFHEDPGVLRRTGIVLYVMILSKIPGRDCRFPALSNPFVYKKRKWQAHIPYHTYDITITILIVLEIDLALDGCALYIEAKEVKVSQLAKMSAGPCTTRV
jgi:hypothetical protein